MEAYSSQTQHPVFKSLRHHVGELKLTVLLVLTTEQTFNMAHLHCDFYFPRKAFVKSYCYRRPITCFLLWGLSVKSLTWPALVSSSPRQKAIIINILLTTFSRSMLWITDPHFIALIWINKSLKKNWVRNKQYGPITQLIRCVYYMAESVFTMQLVNLLSVTCYTDQNV